jgi:uncharacterized protein YxeA
MKRILILLFAFVMSAALSLAAQESANQDQSSGNSKKVQKAEKKEAKAAQKGKDMTLTGWVREMNGKTVFVNDKDKQDWDISNMDAVKGHEGHHVKVKAKLDEANHSLTVDKLTMMRKGKQTAKTQQEEKK